MYQPFELSGEWSSFLSLQGFQYVGVENSHDCSTVKIRATRNNSFIVDMLMLQDGSIPRVDVFTKRHRADRVQLRNITTKGLKKTIKEVIDDDVDTFFEKAIDNDPLIGKMKKLADFLERNGYELEEADPYWEYGEHELGKRRGYLMATKNDVVLSISIDILSKLFEIDLLTDEGIDVASLLVSKDQLQNAIKNFNTMDDFRPFWEIPEEAIQAHSNRKSKSRKKHQKAVR